MKEKQNLTFLKVLTSVTFLAMIVINALANIIPIGGVGTGEVSDSLPNLFAPTALTFSIWGVIYLLLAMYTLYQIGVFNKKENANSELTARVSKLFALSSVANSVWIFAWHYKVIWLSFILMLTIFVFLLMITLELRKHELTGREKLFVRLPFSVYFGWITVATIANATGWLVDIGWNGFGLPEEIWAVIIIAIGAVIGFFAIVLNRDFFYGLVLVWAYAGILLKHVSASGFEGDYTLVIVTVSICLALLVAADALALLPRKAKS